MAKERVAVFDDWKSWGHFVLGVVAAQLGIFSILVILAFVLYQNREKEKQKFKLGDYIEFLMGFSAGLALTSR